MKELFEKIVKWDNRHYNIEQYDIHAIINSIRNSNTRNNSVIHMYSQTDAMKHHSTI